MMALLGLHDDYVPDGRVLMEGLNRNAVPQGLDAHHHTVEQLGATYEQLNAAFGEFALETLKTSTTALNSTDDSTYNDIENQIAALTQQRDDLATKIKTQLNAAAFDDQPLDEQQAKDEIQAAQQLIEEARALR
jgi:hypothetical protein